MNLKDNKVLAMAAVAVVTAVLQVPGIGHWYGQISDSHTHVVTIVEGIFGLVTIIWATKKPSSLPTDSGIKK